MGYIFLLSILPAYFLYKVQANLRVLHFGIEKEALLIEKRKTNVNKVTFEYEVKNETIIGSAIIDHKIWNSYKIDQQLKVMIHPNFPNKVIVKKGDVRIRYDFFVFLLGLFMVFANFKFIDKRNWQKTAWESG